MTTSIEPKRTGLLALLLAGALIFALAVGTGQFVIPVPPPPTPSPAAIPGHSPTYDDGFLAGYNQGKLDLIDKSRLAEDKMEAICRIANPDPDFLSGYNSGYLQGNPAQ